MPPTTKPSTPAINNLKRKRDNQQDSPQSRKRRPNIFEARAIAAQTKDKAYGDGELNIEKFTKAREFEIKALEDGMKKSKDVLSQRAFQSVPRDLRRRTASHNVKRVPKRLRARAAKEMLEDNTPTVTARKRKPTGHQRLRLELAKKAQTPKSKLDKLQKKLISGIIKPRAPKVKKNVLQKPDKPKAKFRKRQICKSWLPTHIFHAKRAHMTPPKEPLWRMAIPLAPTQKCYRPTHRASTLRGAIAWDMSYMSTIGLEGPEQAICGVLKALGVGKDDGEQFWQKRMVRWLKGTRSWSGWLYEREGWPQKSIAPVTIVWCPQAEQESDQMEVDGAQKKLKQPKRQALVRVHPAAFLQLWEELLRLSKIQKPGLAVIDMRFEIGSIELVGPAAAEALTGALWAHRENQGDVAKHSGVEEVWDVLRGVASPGSLPADAILPLDISDPRLHQPLKTQAPPTDAESQHRLLNILASWPIDKAPPSTRFFSRAARLAAQRQMPSQKAINRRKALAEPGAYPSAQPTDPKIPILVLPTRGDAASQGSWTILMPWKCVLPVWYSLLFYPLSSGGTIRFRGLEQKRQIAFESGRPWFPGDFPGTKAGDAWEAQETAKRKKEWERRPKGKRVEFDSLKLDQDRKGEVGAGWSCDWEKLWPAPAPSADEMDMDMDGQQQRAIYRVPKALAKGALAAVKAGQSRSALLPSGGLATVNLTLLQRGVPTTCARIYRLPTTNPALLQQWLTLHSSTKNKRSSNLNKAIQHPPRPSRDAPAHELRRYLAQSLLLSEEPQKTPQVGDAEYPVVPEEQDLIGFVTTGNFNLGEGRGTGVGCVALEKVLDLDRGDEEQAVVLEGKAAAAGAVDGQLCIVREAGQAVGRLARWKLV